MTDKEFLKKLGKRILKKRESLDLTQEELSQKVKLTRMQIYRIEKGESPTTIIVLRSISKAFKISLKDLVDL